MAFRAAFGRLPAYVHVYFHDTDLLDGRRRLALEYALVVIGRRRTGRAARQPQFCGFRALKSITFPNSRAESGTNRPER